MPKSEEIERDWYNEEFGSGHWSEYTMLNGYPFGTDEHQEGWYTHWVVYYRTIGIWYEDYPEASIRYLLAWPAFYDFFYYDKDTDTIIDFTDMRATMDYDFSIEEVQIAEGPARVYKNECKLNFLGKNFLVVVADTIYQNK